MPVIYVIMAAWVGAVFTGGISSEVTANQVKKELVAQPHQGTVVYKIGVNYHGEAVYVCEDK